MDIEDGRGGARAEGPMLPTLTQQHLETIFRATQDVVMVLDGESQRIVFVNETVQRVLGYLPGAMIGQTLTTLLAGDDSEYLEEAQLVDGVYGPVRLRCADGAFRHADVTIAVVPWDGLPALLYSLRDVTERTQMEEERAQLIEDLREALATVKQLSGLLPICAGCKRIRDDDGYWATVEQYFSQHTEAKFSHGLCPKCRVELYPEYPVDDVDSGAPGPAQGGELS